jgi:hypothetical protein
MAPSPGDRPHNAKVRLVGRPDFAHDRAARGHHVRHAERPANLDELPARDDDLLAESQGVEDEDGPGGIVVAEGRRFGARQLGQEAADVGVALAAAPRFEVEGERAVSPGDVVEGGAAGLGENGPAEPRMHQDPGGVDGFLETQAGPFGESCLDPGQDGSPADGRIVIARFGKLPRGGPSAGRRARSAAGQASRRAFR